jgi:hypothetical protein
VMRALRLVRVRKGFTVSAASFPGVHGGPIEAHGEMVHGERVRNDGRVLDHVDITYSRQRGRKARMPASPAPPITR